MVPDELNALHDPSWGGNRLPIVDSRPDYAIAARRAIEAVLALHREVTAKGAFYGDKDARECAECRSGVWPCRTVTACGRAGTDE